jgi:hypothetical protein
MAMYPCSKCLENSWKFELADAVTVRATCQHCGREVEFLTHKGKKMAAGWIPPLPTTGTHAPDYVPIQHGPGPGDDPDEVPWYETRAEMLAAEAKARSAS